MTTPIGVERPDTIRLISERWVEGLLPHLAAVLLFLFGSGPVRGFAVVLVIGLFTSVFTAVTFTRMLVAQWIRREKPKTINI